MAQRRTVPPSMDSREMPFWEGSYRLTRRDVRVLMQVSLAEAF
jgi:hypothetical protein